MFVIVQNENQSNRLSDPTKYLYVVKRERYQHLGGYGSRTIMSSDKTKAKLYKTEAAARKSGQSILNGFFRIIDTRDEREVLEAERLIRLKRSLAMADELQTKLHEFELELDRAHVTGAETHLSKAWSAINTLYGHVGREHRRVANNNEADDE